MMLASERPVVGEVLIAVTPACATLAAARVRARAAVVWVVFMGGVREGRSWAGRFLGLSGGAGNLGSLFRLNRVREYQKKEREATVVASLLWNF
jgi:hypothetical protein